MRIVPGTRSRPCASRRTGSPRRALVDLADHFLEQILERDDAGGAAVLVDHHHHLRPLPPHRREHGVERRGLGHERQRPRVAGPIGSSLQQQPQQILDVDHAEDVIEVALR